MQGVKLLRAEMYEEALASFRAALAVDSGDHRAAFGAGVACEAMGQCDSALSFYKQACVGAGSRVYMVARDRMKTYGHRVRG